MNRGHFLIVRKAIILLITAISNFGVLGVHQNILFCKEILFNDINILLNG